MNIKQFYNFLIVIAGLIAVYSILVFMPMFFTYLSEGDTRAPSGGMIAPGQSASELHAKKYAAP
jgi:hypothetical protein